jgi:Ala-tRNA(Pro) deacylase
MTRWRLPQASEEETMSAAPKLTEFLTNVGAKYDFVAHDPTMSSMRSAEASHISADSLAKAVVLLDDDGYLLAVLPASHHLRFDDLEQQGHWPVRMATEQEIDELFPDCVRGAVPPVGAAYGLKTIVDDSMVELPDVYFEGGDHSTLVHVSGPTFDRIMTGAEHARFSSHA